MSIYIWKKIILGGGGGGEGPLWPLCGSATVWMGHQLIIQRRGVVYWRSGNRFQMLPAETNTIAVSNMDEEYFTYNNIDQSQQSKWMLVSMGELKDLNYGSSIARANKYYGYNTNVGCQRWKQLVCRHRGEAFELRPRYYYSDPSILSNSSLGISDCRDACWNNCACVAYCSLFDNGTWCQFWIETSMFFLGTEGKVYFLAQTSGSGKLICSLYCHDVADAWRKYIRCYLWLIETKLLVLG